MCESCNRMRICILFNCWLRSTELERACVDNEGMRMIS